MEHRLERPFARPVAGLDLHDVGHVIPPAPHQRMLRKRPAAVAGAQLERREKRARQRIEENMIVEDARVAEQRRELRPDLIVPAAILLRHARLELHAERKRLRFHTLSNPCLPPFYARVFPTWPATF